MTLMHTIMCSSVPLLQLLMDVQSGVDTGACRFYAGEMVMSMLALSDFCLCGHCIRSITVCDSTVMLD